MWEIKGFIKWLVEFLQEKRIVVESRTAQMYNPDGHTTTKKYYIENK